MDREAWQAPLQSMELQKIRHMEQPMEHIHLHFSHVSDHYIAQLKFIHYILKCSQKLEKKRANG